MGYKVVYAFADGQDGGYVYRTGDTYPRDGVEPDALRIANLSSTANAFGFPLIEESKPAGKAEAKAEAKKPARKTNTKADKA